MNKKWSHKHFILDMIFDKNFLKFISSVIILVIFFAFLKSDIADFDITLFVSVIMLFLCNFIANWIYAFYTRKAEDSRKLSNKCDNICRLYNQEKLLKYNNYGKEETFPMIVLAIRRITAVAFDIVMNDCNSDKVFEQPEDIKKNSVWLLDAHRCSYQYNSRTVRLDDFKQKGNKVELTYSNACYWDLLMTNRVMDYEWKDGRTIRNIYELGPYINSLKDSKMANHIGFNGFIEFEGDGILFIKRSGKMSVGKKILGTSVSAKLNPLYDYKKYEKLTTELLYEAIAQAVNRELKYFTVNNSHIEVDHNDIKNSIFAFYRDLVEGGKPQILFYYKIKGKDESGCDVRFEKGNKRHQISRDKKLAKIDGDEYTFITLSQLRNAYISNNSIYIYDLKKKYKMTSSAAASVVMLLDAYK